jgi:hypothetical protein
MLHNRTRDAWTYDDLYIINRNRNRNKAISLIKIRTGTRYSRALCTRNSTESGDFGGFHAVSCSESLKNRTGERCPGPACRLFLSERRPRAYVRVSRTRLHACTRSGIPLRSVTRDIRNGGVETWLRRRKLKVTSPARSSARSEGTPRAGRDKHRPRRTRTSGSLPRQVHEGTADPVTNTPPFSSLSQRGLVNSFRPAVRRVMQTNHRSSKSQSGNGNARILRICRTCCSDILVGWIFADRGRPSFGDDFRRW